MVFILGGGVTWFMSRDGFTCMECFRVFRVSNGDCYVVTVVWFGFCSVGVPVRGSCCELSMMYMYNYYYDDDMSILK